MFLEGKVPELMFNDSAEGGSVVMKIMNILPLRILFGTGQLTLGRRFSVALLPQLHCLLCVAVEEYHLQSSHD
jgi:hypothetical protein